MINWKSLLIDRGGSRKKKKVLTAPAVISPLLTSFHKWAGKKRLLLFDSKETYEEATGADWNLDRNLFATLLRSPIRMDQASRVKIPRDLMIQMKVEPVSNVPNKIAQLIPQLKPYNKGSSSYVANSLKLFEEKGIPLQQLIPAFVHDSRTVSISPDEINLDRKIFSEKYKADLIRLVETSLLDRAHYDNVEPVVIEDWDIILTYDENNANDIELVKLKQVQSQPTVIILNLKLLENETFKQLLTGRLKNHELGIVLKILKDEGLIRSVYSLVNFSR